MVKYKIIGGTSKKDPRKCYNFLYTLRLRHGQLLLIIQYSSLLLLTFQPKSHWRCLNKVGFVNLAECLVGFESGTFLLICNVLTHWATLLKLGYSR